MPCEFRVLLIEFFIKSLSRQWRYHPTAEPPSHSIVFFHPETTQWPECCESDSSKQYRDNDLHSPLKSSPFPYIDLLLPSELVASSDKGDTNLHKNQPTQAAETSR